MERIIFTLLCTLCACTSFAQTKNSFVITSDIPDLPDGIEVELETAEGSNYDEVARAVVQDGKFVLTGRLTHHALHLVYQQLQAALRNGVERRAYMDLHPHLR